jgi:hypothetical protein
LAGDLWLTRNDFVFIVAASYNNAKQVKPVYPLAFNQVGSCLLSKSKEAKREGGSAISSRSTRKKKR